MNNSLFCRNEFVLCDVPVPKGYPQSQTHAGVFLYKDRLFLSTSPYPLIKHSRWYYYMISALKTLHLGFFIKKVNAEKYENPLLYIAANDNNTVFKLIQDKPLMDTPVEYYDMPAYNSDPDLYIERDTIYVLNRSYFRKQLSDGKVGSEVWLYLIKGTLDNNKFKYCSTTLLKEWSKSTIVSPCLTLYKGSYYLFYLDTNSALDKTTFNGLYFYKANAIESLPNNTCIKIPIIGDGILPWHMSVFKYANSMYAIVTCVIQGKGEKLWQLLGKFGEDLSYLKIYRTPLTDYNSYRGSAYIDDKDIFHLYNTTLRDRIRGSKSVDGRDVILASKPFEMVINYLEDNEREM